MAAHGLSADHALKMDYVMHSTDTIHAYNAFNLDESVIQFVNTLLQNAIHKNASDIHLEPQAESCRIRFRCDGLLIHAMFIEPDFALKVMTRFKIMANLNIAERRLPQDGRIQLQIEAKIDMRINTCPTLFGEKIVLRILDSNPIYLDINTLGFTSEQQALFLKSLSLPQGLILVTGPTGSGKTMTLYSALAHLNQIEKNILTVEDPVEIELAGINQVNINTRIGLDFAKALRTFLRQDPDILMVGEVRDAETATIAMQAAQTGHLVLSTMHTNSASETITRLQSMNIAAYHLASSLTLVIAQRLIRKLCMHCKLPDDSSINAYRAVGCEYCNHGYHGRIGIFELLPMTESITKTILSGANSQIILQQMRQENAVLLWESGLEKIRTGITSYSELMRVLGNDQPIDY